MWRTRGAPATLVAAMLLSLAPALAQDAPPQVPSTAHAPPSQMDPVAEPVTAPAAEPAAASVAEAVSQPAAEARTQELAVPEAAAAPAGASATIPHDLSPMGMFMAADIVVKSVMVGLAVASLVTWTVCAAKALELLAARWRLRRSLRVVLAAPDLAAADRALAGRGGPAPAMVHAARMEASASADVLGEAGSSGLLGRVASHLGRIEARAGRRLGIGTGILATIGSTAPFVGLFGTVWGIMNAFIGISESRTTNLAVVAPGIAEALLATALGLVAAIPAVVLYNVFARSITTYRALLGDAAAGVERLVSRDLDHRRLAPAGRMRAAE